jgi:hypothetical protein
MSEIKLIEEFCAVVPAPDQARHAAIRARVLEQAQQATKPVTRRDSSRLGSGGPGLLSWPRLALTGTIAVAAAVALIVASLIAFGGSTTPASAAELLKHAETAALAQPVPTDKELVYSDSAIYYATYTGAGQPDGHVTVRQQEWQSPASPTAFYYTRPCAIDGDLQRGQAACSFQGGYAPGATAYSTYLGLQTLPQSARRLLAYLATLPGPGGLSRPDREWSGANLIAELNPVLPPQFGAALFRAIAQIPGTTLLPSASDSAGAHGIGLSRAAGGTREELIFDLGTYRLIGQQYIALAQRHGHSADYVTAATALLHTRLVSTGPGSAAVPGPGSITAGSGSGASPRNDQFIVTDTAVVGLAPSSRQRTGYRFTTLKATQLMWQSVDGSRPGALATVPCRAGASSCLLLIPPGPDNPVLFTYAGIKGLPRTPGALSSYLSKHNSCPASIPAGARSTPVADSTREWNAITAMLGNDLVLPPGLGQVVFQTAEAIPGTVVLRNVTDAAGGHGIAVAKSETAALRMELIFAPRSYQFIGVQEVLTRHVPGIRAGMVWAAMSVLSAQVVNTAPVTSLGQSYQPSTCGFTPDMVAAGSTGSGSTGSGSTGSGSTGSGSTGSSSSGG